jgi:hypothetical protein
MCDIIMGIESAVPESVGGVGGCPQYQKVLESLDCSIESSGKT